MTSPVSIGSPLPAMRCFVPGHRATTVAAVGEGECLVLYVGGSGVRSSDLDRAARWPLPSLPRTTYAVVDHESATHGFLRTQMIEDVAGEVRRSAIAPDRTRVFHALITTTITRYESPLQPSGGIMSWCKASKST